MQTSAHPAAPSETDKVRATLAERLSGFPLITARPQQAQLDARLAKQQPRRFTGEPVTGFGALA